jgi:lipoprotein-anchoring transpeptidase ErfK/SrfK
MFNLILFFVFFHGVNDYINRPQEEPKIRVDFKKVIIEYSDESGNVVANFPVALPMVDPKLPIMGRVESISMGVTWFPTEATREAYLKQNKVELPKRIPPGHPLNAMGVGCINIAFEKNLASSLIKIHGTNAPKSIGSRISRGCIRMQNNDFIKLVKLITGKSVRVVFE